MFSTIQAKPKIQISIPNDQQNTNPGNVSPLPDLNSSPTHSIFLESQRKSKKEKHKFFRYLRKPQSFDVYLLHRSIWSDSSSSINSLDSYFSSNSTSNYDQKESLYQCQNKRFSTPPESPIYNQPSNTNALFNDRGFSKRSSIISSQSDLDIDDETEEEEFIFIKLPKQPEIKKFSFESS
ncbi:hypothetical protein G9A89_022202 [Geosiphon pyriformis]|nr:hypothetical protein G9A89_022202 [Geosiphon pyriformis]